MQELQLTTYPHDDLNVVHILLHLPHLQSCHIGLQHRLLNFLWDVQSHVATRVLCVLSHQILLQQDPRLDPRILRVRRLRTLVLIALISVLGSLAIVLLQPQTQATYHLSAYCYALHVVPCFHHGADDALDHDHPIDLRHMSCDGCGDPRSCSNCYHDVHETRQNSDDKNFGRP